MTFRVILAPVFGDDADPAALDAGLAVARRFDAHLAALFVRLDPRDAIPIVGEGVSPAIMDQLTRAAEAEMERRRNRAKAAFETACAHAGIALAETPRGPRTVSAGWGEALGRRDQIVPRRARVSDLVVFATVAAEPHVRDVSWFDHNPLVLHVSLRDLAPDILLASTNVVDDVEHCLKANTSPHLVEQLTGNRDFLAGTLDEVMAGRVSVRTDRPVIFSPFGLGVLDLAVGKYVYDTVAASGELHVIDDFFHELRRYG